MFFTQEDFNKIEKYLQQSGKRDSTFNQANLPLVGDELIAVVQEDTNKILTIDELGASISQYISVEGFLYKGIATPNTRVPEKSKGLFWIAGEKGIYTELGGFELDGTILYILKNNNGIWEKDSLGVRLDAISIAEEAKQVADRAFSISSEMENKVAQALDKATSAEDTALAANKSASVALDKANAAIPMSDRGKPGGVPILDNTGLVPKSQLPIVEIELINSYLSDRTDAAPTASALHDLYKFHEGDIITLNNTVNAILDFIKDSSEIGVYPVDIKITSLAQEVNVQIICNGTWNITEIPEHVTASATSGTGNSSITLSFKANPSETEAKTGSIKVENSFGKYKTIEYTQYAASAIYKYEVSVTPNPINVLATAGSGELTVTSIKTPYVNNEPSGDPELVPFTISKPTSDTWYTLSGDNNTTYTHTENTLEASRSSIITIHQDEVGGVSTTVSITQAKAVITSTYTFTIVPADLEINDLGVGGVYPAEITSTKTTIINGVSKTEPVDYSTSYTGEASSLWVTYSKVSNNITVILNNTENSRSGGIVFTQNSPTAPKITVPISQAGAVVTWNYVFEYSPASMVFGNAASSKQYIVSKSIKQKLINGEPTGEEVNVAWDVSITGAGFSLNKETSTVSVTENTTEGPREGTLVFSRAEVGESGNKAVALTQDAGVVTWSYSLNGSINPSSIAALNGTTVLTVTSTKQKFINGITTGNPVNVAWHGTSTNGYLKGSDISGSTWTMTENRTESAREDILVINQLEDGGKSLNIPVIQAAASVTYNYVFSITPNSLQFLALGEVKNVTIVSTKQKLINGTAQGSTSNVAFEIGIGPSWVEFRNSGQITTLENKAESQRSYIFTVTQGESNKTASVAISQAAASIQYDYQFTVIPRSLSFGYSGGTQSVAIVSTRQKYLNGVAEGSPTAVEVTKTVNGNGFTANGFTSITASTNTGAARSHSFTYKQALSEISYTVTCSQEAGVIGYNYYMSASPTSLSFTALGSTKSITVSSYRRKTINGVETGESENISYTSSISGTGFSVTNTTRVTAAENKRASSRSGSITFTASSGGKTATVSLSQDAATISSKYYFSVTPLTLTFTAASSTKSVAVTSCKNTVINGKEQSDRLPVSYTYSNRQDWQSIADFRVITVTKNTATTARSSTLNYNQAESGNTTQVTITQDALAYKYNLTVSPTSLSFIPTGETKAVTITSNKQEVIGGAVQPGIIPINFGHTVTGSGFSVDSSGTRITAGNNTSGSTRSGKVTYNQIEGTATAEVTLTQDTSNPQITINYTNGIPGVLYYLFDQSDGPATDPSNYEAFMSGTNGIVRFYKIDGITVNDAMQGGGQVTVQVGSRYVIRAASDGQWFAQFMNATVPATTSVVNVQDIAM